MSVTEEDVAHEDSYLSFPLEPKGAAIVYNMSEERESRGLGRNR